MQIQEIAKENYKRLEKTGEESISGLFCGKFFRLTIISLTFISSLSNLKRGNFYSVFFKFHNILFI